MADECGAGDARADASDNADRYRLLVQNAADLITIVDREGHLLWVNPAVARMFGRGSAELLDMQTLPFVHPEDATHVRAVFEDVVARKGAGPTVEFRALVPN